MVGHSFPCFFLSKFRDQRFRLLLLVAHELLDPIQGAVAEEFPRSQTSDAVKTVLGTNNRIGTAGWPIVVPVGAQGGSAARHSRVDVLFHHLLDVVCAFWSFKFL